MTPPDRFGGPRVTEDTLTVYVCPTHGTLARAACHSRLDGPLRCNYCGPDKPQEGVRQLDVVPVSRLEQTEAERDEARETLAEVTRLREETGYADLRAALEQAGRERDEAKADAREGWDSYEAVIHNATDLKERLERLVDKSRQVAVLESVPNADDSINEQLYKAAAAWREALAEAACPERGTSFLQLKARLEQAEAETARYFRATGGAEVELDRLRAALERLEGALKTIRNQAASSRHWTIDKHRVIEQVDEALNSPEAAAALNPGERQDGG